MGAQGPEWYLHRPMASDFKQQAARARMPEPRPGSVDYHLQKFRELNVHLGKRPGISLNRGIVQQEADLGNQPPIPLTSAAQGHLRGTPDVVAQEIPRKPRTVSPARNVYATQQEDLLQKFLRVMGLG